MPVSPPPRSASTAPSARLRKAVEAERQTLERRLRGLQAQRQKVVERLAEVEAGVQQADERLRLFRALHGDDAPAARRDEAGQLLEGPAIRSVAVVLLRDHAEGQGPVHYRRWLEIVERAGYEVA